MKSVYPVSAAFLFALVLASGCVHQAGGTNGVVPPGEINPPPQNPPPLVTHVLKPGDWARIALTTTSATPVEFTYVSVETAINGVTFSGIETLTESGSSLVLWEKGKEIGGARVKAYSLTKFGQIVLCNAVMEKTQNLPGTKDPYSAGGTGITSLGTGSFTTPTGKTVNVNKYYVQSGGISGEYWYSDEVPFAFAKSETNTTVAGKLITAKTELEDFGTGVRSSFAEKDFQKCG